MPIRHPHPQCKHNPPLAIALLVLPTYLRDGVGVVTVGDGGRLGAVGDVLRDNLGDVGNVAPGEASHGAGGGGEDNGSGELHFDGFGGSGDLIDSKRAKK